MTDKAGSVGVIGAGIGGLVLGLAAARAGMSVNMYERVSELGEVGAGITISPNADRVLQHIGLGPEISRLAYVPQRQWTQNWSTGEILIDKERGPDVVRKYGAGYYHLHRADLHTMLVDAFLAEKNTELLLEHELVDCDQDGTCTFANGKTVSADVIVGADGVKSSVRDCLFASSPAKFSGQVAWRGVVPVGRLNDDSKLRHPGIHIGPQRLVARYPVRDGQLINYAAFVELNGWEEESWSIRSTIAELASHFEGCDPELMAMIRATPEDQIFKWALHVREPLDTWVAGRVTLLGDAAHPMLPFMGQGAGTAIEDAMILSRTLAAYPVPDALRAYAAARLDRTSMVQLNSRLMGLVLQGENPEDYGKGPVRNEEILGLFDYDAVNEPVWPFQQKEFAS